ncbi:MAG: hypothetical protein BGO55_04370 [Sphingobacteriales bacterium 50-39]|nr:RagB/SusD family nutrient uptake outer membrane protein [Sphingobacteriales bacterium]OJW55862.1 MAG: hypothetical protein BGO55_04370 [Sphingobacteriales bacterium 50-39]
MKTKHILTWSLAAVTSILFSNCTKVLDKSPLTALTSSDLWSSPAAATSYLNGVYYNEMPCMPYGTGNAGGCSPVINNWWWGGWVSNTNLVNYGNGNGTDEAIPTMRGTDKFLLGTATYDFLENYDNAALGVVNNWAVGTFQDIRTINQILANVDGASFDQADKDLIKGQALFFRAWAYNKLVKDIGGVPLILKPQPVTDLTSLQLPRNKTSECVTQILSDLDSAIALLPNSWSGADVGRIDKGAAMAFKGRVLLFFASPLFNGLNGIATWQKAYDACLAAKTFVDGQGKGLYAPFKNIWSDRLNKEVIMVRRFSTPGSDYPVPGIIPLRYTADDWGVDCASLELLNAFPMSDGSAWDPTTMAYDTLFMHRDDRFYATIIYNGAPVQFSPQMVSKKEYFWTYLDNGTVTGAGGMSGTRNTVTSSWEGWGEENLFFFRLKGVDQSAQSVEHSGTDWPEIRYAEVLMNMGEAANELGNTADALKVLYQIRQRAGIAPGIGGNYGITALTQADIRTAYQNERFVEFAFEGKRWDDIRRWKLFGKLRAMGQRHGLAVVKKASVSAPAVTPMEDINTAWNKFDYTKITADAGPLNISDNCYIYGIPYTILQRNPKFQQNNGWNGGSFDPFQ